jgi:hypothetical protein
MLTRPDILIFFKMAGARRWCDFWGGAEMPYFKRFHVSHCVKVKVKVTLRGPIQHCGLKADCTLAPEIVPSSPEALCTKRHKRPLLAKERN